MIGRDRYSLLRRCAGVLFVWIVFCLPLLAEDFYEVHPKPHEGYEVKDDKIYYRNGNTGLILELASSNKVAEYYLKRGSQVSNPFAAMGPEIQTATIFLLTLINRSRGDATFTPGYVVLRIKDNGVFAIDFTTLLPMLDDLEKNQRKLVEDTVFHSPSVIRPGTAVAKFLIFPRMPTKFSEYKLAFDYVFLGNKEGKIDFYFQRVKVTH